MIDPAERLIEDRALRNAARRLVKSDVGFIRESLTAQGLAARLIGRLGQGARDIGEEAAEVANKSRTMIGGGLIIGSVAATAWVFRARLVTLINDFVQRASASSPVNQSEAEQANRETGVDRYGAD